MQMVSKTLVIAGFALMAIPGTLLAQDKKPKEKKDIQTIVITRTGGEVSDKTIIEIDGDKVKINGKEAKDNKDVRVNINTIKGATVINTNNENGNWSFSMGDDRMTLYSEDNNRAMLGVVTESHARGAEIKSVTKESAAEKIGLKKGDILTRIGDKKIANTEDVTAAIRDRKPGEKVEVAYLREGKEEKKTAELGKWKGVRVNAVTAPRFDDMPQMPHIDRVPFESWNDINWGGRPRLGMTIQDTDDAKGVKIMEVEDDGLAAKGGLKKDDIILAVDDKEVKSTDEISKILRESREGTFFKFRVSRAGKTQDVEVRKKKIKTADL